MDRRTFLGLAAGGTAALAGCFGAETEPSTYDIGMRASAFVPASFETTVGGTVRWRNTNSRAHTVTAYEASRPDGAAYFASGEFDTESAARDAFWDRLGGGMSTGETFERTFTIPGTYRYFCVPHEAGGMVGSVVVRE